MRQVAIDCRLVVVDIEDDTIARWRRDAFAPGSEWGALMSAYQVNRAVRNPRLPRSFHHPRFLMVALGGGI
jgi:hypothetical protein